MTDYLVYNDQTGEFCSAELIIAVREVLIPSVTEGSMIFITGYTGFLSSPLKPRELLRRLTIMRFKRENGEAPNRIEYSKASRTGTPA
jgi:hypothetical protein